MICVLLGFLDLSTGLEAPGPAGLVPSPRPETQAKAGAVLWDQTHGIFLDYRINGKFSQLRDYLISNGYSFDTTVAGVDNENLDAYRIVVLNLGSNWNSAYTAAEADSIAAYVARGGSVLIQSENTSCPNANLNQIVSRFNMTVGLGNPASCFTSFSTNPVYSDMFLGVTTVCTQAPGEVDASAPSELIGWMGSAGGMAGRCEQDQGGVVLVSDINLWDNTNFSTGDNALFALNVFDWLSSPPCSPTYIGRDEEDAADRSLLRVLPVPAKGFLDIALPPGAIRAVMYTPAGSAVMELGEGRTDVSGLPPGVYFLRAGNQMKRVIIAR